MRRLRGMLLLVFVGGLFLPLSGCGEDQPNAPAQPEQVDQDFLKNTADMMKKANTGMDKNAAQKK